MKKAIDIIISQAIEARPIIINKLRTIIAEMPRNTKVEVHIQQIIYKYFNIYHAEEMIVEIHTIRSDELIDYTSGVVGDFTHQNTNTVRFDKLPTDMLIPIINFLTHLKEQDEL